MTDFFSSSGAGSGIGASGGAASHPMVKKPSTDKDNHEPSDMCVTM